MIARRHADATSDGQERSRVVKGSYVYIRGRATLQHRLLLREITGDVSRGSRMGFYTEQRRQVKPIVHV